LNRHVPQAIERHNAVTITVPISSEKRGSKATKKIRRIPANAHVHSAGNTKTPALSRLHRADALRSVPMVCPE